MICHEAGGAFIYDQSESSCGMNQNESITFAIKFINYTNNAPWLNLQTRSAPIIIAADSVYMTKGHFEA